MKIIGRLFTPILLVALFSFGCAVLEKPRLGLKKRTPQPSRERPVIAEEILKEKVESLSKRIREYGDLERKLEKEGKGDSRALTELRQSQWYAEDLIRTYRMIGNLQSKLSGYSPYAADRKVYRAIIERLFQELTGLESGYFEDRDESWFAEEQFLTRYESEIKEIEGCCAGKDYPKLVESYKRVEAIYGEDLIPVKLRLCYADALSLTDQVNEAIEVAERVVENDSPDSTVIRATLIEWYLKSKRPEKALKNFEKLSNELDKKMEIFLSSRNRITSPMDGEPDEPTKKLSIDGIVEEDLVPVEDDGTELEEGEGIKGDELKQDSLWEMEEGKKVGLDEGLKRANDLMNERRFHEARGILLHLRASIWQPQEREAVENSLRSLRLEENKAKGEEEEERFMMAKKLIECERYEDAITELNKLRDGERYGRESQEMTQRSIDEFARKKRGEAAKLFLMAKKTTDSMEKKELLSRSFKLLKEVIKKYPTSSYSGKIIKNIEAVKEEMLEIDLQSSKEEFMPH